MQPKQTFTEDVARAEFEFHPHDGGTRADYAESTSAHWYSDTEDPKRVHACLIAEEVDDPEEIHGYRVEWTVEVRRPRDVAHVVAESDDHGRMLIETVADAYARDPDSFRAAKRIAVTDKRIALNSWSFG